MKSHVKAIVIGGGVVGCSVLYHLARAGWTDIMLIERSELTSGSSWHAAGGFHTLNGDPNVAKLQAYTVQLYKEIEEISGQSCSLHLTGGVMMADTPERMDFLRLAHAKGRYLGMDTELITPSEAKAMFPLMDEKNFVGAMWDPVEGHLDPSGTTIAYSKAAKKLGAEIVLRNRVVDLTQQPDGTWNVVTEQGTVHAEHVVNCGGLWAREIGRMVGVELPVLAMEHMYLLTEPMPEVEEFNKSTGREMIGVLDFKGEIYTRQERNGILLGTYEKACKPWSPVNTPWDFGHELLQPDIDRIAPSLEIGFKHFPGIEKAGIKQIINGPFTFALDGNPLVGPVQGLTNFWCACAVMAGFSQGGGVGLALSNWMVHGDPGFDVWGMDVARFGEWAGLRYTNAKVRENYSRRFSIRFPNEELPAGRPLKTTPVYDTLAAKGAQWGVSYGLEVPLWYAPEGVKDEFSWRRSTDFEHVGKEVAAVRNGVGLSEISNFAKYKVTGEGAAAWLDRMLACRLPKRGRMTLTPMLKDDGRLIGDFTLANIDDAEWFIAGSGIAEQYHMRWFEAHLPKDDSVQIEALGQKLTGLAIAGPKAREVLAKVTRADVSNAAFPFMAVARMDIGMAPCLVGRVSYTGDLGYEIWVAPEYQRAAYHALTAAGAEFGIGLFGSRALNALRLEKNYGSWGREYRPIYGPLEAGLDRFVAYGKEADFIGKAAALAERKQGGKLRLRAFIVDADDADVIGDEPIWFGGAVRGWVTSGGYAHHSKKSVAIGYVPKEIADESDGFEIELLGKRLAARIQAAPLFDVNFERMRG